MEEKEAGNMEEEEIVELSPEEQEQIAQVLQAIAYDIDSGRPLEEIVSDLVESGLDEATARDLVNAIKEDLDRIRADEEEFVNILASRLYNGENPEDLIEELKDAGMDPDEAKEFITELNDQVNHIKEEEEIIVNATKKGIEDGKSVDDIVNGIEVTTFSRDDVRAFVEELYREMTSE